MLRRRWVIERSIGWLMLHGRLARDYENLPASSDAMIRLTMNDNVSKCITSESAPTWRGAYSHERRKSNTPENFTTYSPRPAPNPDRP